jgi:alkylation response protein AidB-like acyl-CoA dehydrogenase
MSSESVSGIIHKVCRDFRRNEIEPVALDLDEHHDPERVKAIWRKSHDLDLPSMLAPEESGGVGQSTPTAAQVLDEIASACPGMATLFACHLAACLPLVSCGKEKAGLLAALAGEGDNEPVMLALALPESLEMPDPPRLVEREGGDLVLEGSAQLVACASLADHLVLFVEEAVGVTAMVVDLRAPGVHIGETEALLGLHAVPFCGVTFDGCKLAAGDILGERGVGKPFLESTLAALHGFLASIAMGTARSAHAAACRYAQERFQFGKMLIDHHEIRRMLSNMVMKIDMGTAGYLQALSGDSPEALAPGRSCAQAKVFCTDAALEIVFDAIQIHGGYGYMKETGLEKIMRDAKMLQLLGGSNRMLEVG